MDARDRRVSVFPKEVMGGREGRGGETSKMKSKFLYLLSLPQEKVNKTLLFHKSG